MTTTNTIQRRDLATLIAEDQASANPLRSDNPFYEEVLVTREETRVRREERSASYSDLPVVASHTALLDVLDAAKLLVALDNCNYDRDQMRRSGGFDGLREAIAKVEALRMEPIEDYQRCEDCGSIEAGNCFYCKAD